MNQNSRTKNSIINSVYASANQLITILLSFLVRTVFIKTLSAEYLGVNGLFLNIIAMLSLADLGIGISIPYTLYRPLAEDNKEKVKLLMSLYAKIYNVIGIIVLMVGILITPFLHFFIKDIPNIPNLNLIYILFVVNSACSYFLIYKKLLLDSDQKGYVASKVTMNITVIKSMVEIIILYSTKNYILYLAVSIIATILGNVIISKKCTQLYPYIKEKTKGKVSKEDIRELKRNTSALVIYRIGIVALNGTDSLIISKFIGVVMVGIYSNYLLITNAITKVTSQIFEAITASIGNMIVTTNDEKSEDIFYKLQFLNSWLYTLFAGCVVALINPFIKIWIGEEYLLSNLVAFSIGLSLYIFGVQSTVSSYRNAYGLFVQGKYRPIIMTIVNIIVSIILAKKIGILGVIIGTIVSRLFVTGIYDPLVVFKYGFKKSPKQYFLNYIKYIITFIIISVIFLVILAKIRITNYLIWIIIAILLFISINIILVVIFGRSKYFKFYQERLKQMITKRMKGK